VPGLPGGNGGTGTTPGGSNPGTPGSGTGTGTGSNSGSGTVPVSVPGVFVPGSTPGGGAGSWVDPASAGFDPYSLAGAPANVTGDSSQELARTGAIPAEATLVVGLLMMVGGFLLMPRRRG
ncbi:LPXTG cell wall anchor domain-containing protein, partial [Arthrobacter woluwensis]